MRLRLLLSSLALDDRQAIQAHRSCRPSPPGRKTGTWPRHLSDLIVGVVEPLIWAALVALKDGETHTQS